MYLLANLRLKFEVIQAEFITSDYFRESEHFARYGLHIAKKGAPAKFFEL